MLEILLEERPYEVQQDMDFCDHERRKLSPRDDEKDDFQKSLVIFQKMRLLKIPVKSPSTQLLEHFDMHLFKF